MVGKPGFLARCLITCSARFLTRICGQGVGDRKYRFTVLQGLKNTALQFYPDGENLEKNHIIKDTILLRIPYTKNLARSGFLNVPRWLYIQFFMRNPNLRSKKTKF